MTELHEPIRVLLIEDNPGDYALTRELLKDASRSSDNGRARFELAWAPRLEKAIEMLRSQHFDVILQDLSLPDADASEIFAALNEVAPSVPVIVLTGCEDEGTALSAVQHGAQDFLIKGKNSDKLLERTIRHAIERNSVLMELKEAKDRAMAAARAKSEFLANMSHEIRTPLTSILGFAENMLDTELSREDRAQAVQVILRNGNHLLQIISDILDISKIEAERLDLERMPVSLFQLSADIESAMRLRASEKGIDFSVTYKFPLPECVETDPTRLKQILINLVGNGIKFTSRGAVSLIIGQNQSNGMIEFEVKDTGIGISDEQLTRLFGTFSQGDSSITREFGGTGLGLAISKRLAALLGGELKVQSELGKGSSFTVTIPPGAASGLVSEVPVASSSSIVSNSTMPFLQGRVLVAEDGPDNQALLNYLLKRCGLEVEIVADGHAALSAAQAKVFDLILMDQQMPGLDGGEATRQIRAGGFVGPIIAITANTTKEDVARYFAAGSSDFLPKPFMREKFYSLLRKYLKPRAVQQPARGAFDGTDPEYQKVVSTFVERLPSAAVRLTGALEDRNQEALRQIVHQLKPAALFGFPQISNLARQVEKEAGALSQGGLIPAVKELAALCHRLGSSSEYH